MGDETPHRAQTLVAGEWYVDTHKHPLQGNKAGFL